MKKLFKALTTIGTAALAVVGGIYVYRKFFTKDEELDEAFDDEEVFEDTEEDEVPAFDSEDEIFEDEETPVTVSEEAVPADPVQEETSAEETAAALGAEVPDATVEEQEHI
ncbi:MAG: hypothetical protein KH452_03625 [Clostridiales bacterium]|nr:hypothetical protein [Clostridiales bacterium]